MSQSSLLISASKRLFLAPTTAGHYWRTHYADQTFRHLYHLTPVDLALLIPYFIVMVILAFYGIHRYQVVCL